MSKQKTIDPRYYSVRPEWAWSEKNKDLMQVVKLEVSLTTVDNRNIQDLFDFWLTQISATKNTTNEYTIGGCGLTITQKSHNKMKIILFSAGQDVLDSLDYVAESLYQTLIMNDSNILVRWKELPIK